MKTKKQIKEKITLLEKQLKCEEMQEARLTRIMQIEVLKWVLK